MEELDAALQPPRDQRFCVPMEGFQIAKQWLESRKIKVESLRIDSKSQRRRSLRR